MFQVEVVYGNSRKELPESFTVPNVPVTSSAEAFSQEHLTQGPYNQYLIDTKYTTDTGLRVIPKASSGEDQTILNSVVRIHRGVAEKIVVWTVERWNKKPQLPQLNTKDPNEVAIKQDITFANKFQMLNGNFIYRVSGVNYYQLQKPPMSSSKYPIGTTPAEVAPSSANFYDGGDFTDTILDAAFATPGGIQLNIPIRVGR